MKSLLMRIVLLSSVVGGSAFADSSITYEMIEMQDGRDIAEMSYPKFNKSWLNELVEKPQLSWFQALKEEEFNNDIPWYYGNRVDVERQTERVLVLRDVHEEYTGGAHGLHRIEYLNIDLDTQKVLPLKTLFSEKELQALTTIGERYFREHNFLKTDDDFKEKGFFFEDGFTLAKEFAITGEGLKFLYNTYEVAPYAFGAIEFTIPAGEIMKITGKNSVIYQLIEGK